ncbi:MAG: hypothetical protein PVI52_00540 [Chromatiales bacterium]
MSNRSTVFRLLGGVMCIMLALAAPTTWAQEEMDGCATASLAAAFRDGVTSVEQTSVLTIQMRLEKLKFDPLWIDGIMGWRTRLALQGFCRSQTITPSASGIAATLIRLLFLETAAAAQDESEGAAQDLSGPAIYYRWMTPEKSEKAQEASGSAQAAATAGSEGTGSLQETACQGVADTPSQPQPDSAATSASQTGGETDSGKQDQAPLSQSEQSVTLPDAGTAGTDSPNGETPAAEAEEQTSATVSEDTQSASQTITSAEKSASSSDPGADVAQSTTAPADGGATTSDSTTDSQRKVAESTSAESQAAPVQTDSGIGGQQSSQGCQAQQNKPGEQPEQDQTLPAAMVERLKQIEGVAYPNQALFEQAVRNLFKDDIDDYDNYKDKILEQARQGPVEDFATIQVAAADCGCSLDLSKLVYGFYPFWMSQADSEKDQAKGQEQLQQIDFSLFDRIGFYALSLSRQGEILNPLQWSNAENIAQFINQVHKYKVDVDLTVYADHWQDWSDKIMDKASSTVAEFATKKFSVSQADSMLQRIILSLKGSSSSADGVTLIFDNYSRYTDQAGNIVKFIGKLDQKLKDLGSDIKINILLGIDTQALSRQTQGGLLSGLEDILLQDITSSATVDYLLVYLPEPTSDTKKALRRQIEDEFHGAERQEVLRKIVAVLSPDGHEKEARGPYAQFKDDLIYFQDNFAGVGLWPLPLESDESIKNIRYNLINLYSNDENVDYLRAFADDISPQICQFACPNRWLVRVVFDLLLGLVVIYALLATRICRLKEIYQKYFLYFMVLPLVVLLLVLISLACDPFWGEKRDLVIGLFVLMLLTIVITRSVGKMIRPPLP